MKRIRAVVLLAAGVLNCLGQTSTIESVTIEGSDIARDVILEIAGLRAGQAVDQSTVEQACARLNGTGLFLSLEYRYVTTPKGGWALTLSLMDRSAELPATVDIPGLDEAEAWKWLKSRFPECDRKVPEPEAAHLFLASQLERQFAMQLAGRRLTSVLEFVPSAGRTLLAFRPDVLPAIAAMTFSGQKSVPAAELTALMTKVTAGSGYTERRFRELVEQNLRPAFEQRGLYRVQFAAIAAAKVEGGVAVTTTVEEGVAFKLGEVRFSGDDAPRDEMLKAAAFPIGKLADWNVIQNGIWESERPLRRSGYMDAAVKANRILRDADGLLDLELVVNRGRQYRFGQVNFVGLPADLGDLARKIWTLKAGDVYRSDYAREFLNEFARKARRSVEMDVSAKRRGTEPVMDVTLIFR